MPVKSCTEGKMPGWKWGDSGKCYTYPAGDEDASGKAKQKAYLQGAAATGGKMTEDFVVEQFEPPEAGDAPKGVKDILKGAYNSCRTAWAKDHPGDKENATNKTTCSKIAWAAVKNGGWKRGTTGWKKEGEMEVFVLEEGVSDAPWASVDKSKLPKSAFLWVEGDGKLKSQWHLPYKDMSGNVNLGALRAISAAVAGARTGTPMNVPADAMKKLNGLLKKYKIGEYAQPAKKTESVVGIAYITHTIDLRG